MADPTPVGNTSGWLGILNKLGIPQFGRWFLSDTVVPVAIVDTEVILTATAVTPLYAVPASAGELVAPIANTRLADTGALVAGNYAMTILIGQNEAVAGGNQFRIRRRNAADAADVWAFRYGITGYSPFRMDLRFILGAGERVVVENVAAGAAGITYQASIFAALT